MKGLFGLYVAVLLLFPFSSFPGEIKTLPHPLDYRPPLRNPVINPSIGWINIKTITKKLQVSAEFLSEERIDKIGIGLTPGRLNFSAFYERLKTEGLPGVPDLNLLTTKYSGSGFGIKLGLGTPENFINLSYTRRNVENSIDMTGLLQDPGLNERIGMEFKVSFRKIASLTGSFELNGSDMEIPVENEQQTMNDQQKRWRKIFSSYHSGRAPEWAVESAFSLDLKNFRSLISYRNVKLDLQSPGTSFAYESGQSYSVNNEYQITQKLRISTSLTYKNMDEKAGLQSESKSLNAEINMHFDQSGHFMFGMQAKTSKTLQETGSYESGGNVVSGERSDEISFSPTYRLVEGNNEKIISGTLAIGFSEMIIPYEAQPGKNKNYAASLGFNQFPTEMKQGFSLSASYNKSGQPENYISTVGISAGAASRLSKAKKVHLNGNVNFSFSKYEPVNPGGNLSISGGVSFCRGIHEITSFLNFNIPRNDAWINPANNITGTFSPHNLPVGITYAIRF